MPSAATWMNLENIILSEVGQMEKREIVYDITYMWTQIIQMNLFTKQKQTHRHRKQTYGQEYGINRYTLLYRRQINNEDLLYSTRNYIQYLVITCNEEESANIYITESLCCIPVTNTIL